MAGCPSFVSMVSFRQCTQRRLALRLGGRLLKLLRMVVICWGVFVSGFMFFPLIYFDVFMLAMGLFLILNNNG